MYTILTLIFLATVIGFAFRKRLCVPKSPTPAWDEFKTPMGDYVAVSLIVILVVGLVLLITSTNGVFKVKSNEFDCRLIQVNNSYLTLSADRYGEVRFAYMFTDGKNIKTGTTKVFSIIAEGEEPHIHFTQYVNSIGMWALPLTEVERISSEICIPQSLLSNVSREVEQTHDKSGK